MKPGTPLPWRVRGEDECYAGSIQGHPREGERFGEMVTNRNAFCRTKTLGRTNAAYAVMACNALPGLVEALEALAGGCVDVSETAIIVGYPNAKEYLAKARAALAQVNGE